MIDRKKFYDGVRHGPFPGSLTQNQVSGMDPILDVWEESKFTDTRWLAAIFGGVFHETGGKMVPVREGFASTDEGARNAVASLYERGRISSDYAEPSHGFSWFGRGRIQNTHYANYLKLEKRFGHPFTTNPSLLLDSRIDAEVTVYGHVEGIWTGKKLSDYFNGPLADWTGARRIVNGQDKASLIAGYSKMFYADILQAYRPANPI